MGKYLKMADVFDLPILGSRAEFFPLCLDESSAMIAAHAINSHDELVAEVESLSSSLNHANSNHELFERQYYLEKDKCEDLQAEVERLRQALIDAATSLETIHVRSYGKDSFLDSKHEMRSYAGSRAKVARVALAEQ